MAEFPPVPLTLEGSYALHQMFRFRRTEWRQQESPYRDRILKEAISAFGAMGDSSAVYSHIGHKGDLLLLHFRESLDAVHRAELAIAQTELADFLEPVHSYLSVVELGLYESSAKTYADLAAKGIAPHSAEWQAAVAEVLTRQAAAMSSRLYPQIPAARYLCFYPMDRRRGETQNWYQVPMAERQRMMHEHGMIGRRYADSVKQIITGSIGFDDWEWGVDLFADEPLVFKKLIYEMRFDEVSAVYAQFGSFYLGVRIRASELPCVLAGELP
jgi:hydrogen peroxide-dependent heme synthase